MMTEVGAAYFDADEAAHLGDYLLKGGFLWADDFWGEYAWQRLSETQIGRRSRGEYPNHRSAARPSDVPHAVRGEEGPADSVDQFLLWLAAAPPSAAPTVPCRTRAIFDERGHMMVLMTHNTDFGDAFEREGENRAYFDRFAGVGYAFGINALLYAMTH